MQPVNIDTYFDKINEITIIVSGHAKLWYVGISEMKHLMGDTSVM
ncbi:hypothetical protein [Paenibacillus peoriae]|nr:hypothetical protein [Paenibacillus peoriae]